MSGWASGPLGEKEEVARRRDEAQGRKNTRQSEKASEEYSGRRRCEIVLEGEGSKGNRNVPPDKEKKALQKKSNKPAPSEKNSKERDPPDNDKARTFC